MKTLVYVGRKARDIIVSKLPNRCSIPSGLCGGQKTKVTQKNEMQNGIEENPAEKRVGLTEEEKREKIKKQSAVSGTDSHSSIIFSRPSGLRTGGLIYCIYVKPAAVLSAQK